MKIQCPECQSDAVYKYGLISNGKQRFICLLCVRQFITAPDKLHFKNRPRCPECNKPMHSYMKRFDYLRFRCSDYPNCKTYLKVREAEFEIINAEMISREFNPEQFFREIDGRPSWEVLCLANEEATAAERFLMKAKMASHPQRRKISDYIETLSDFMLFMRSTIRIPASDKNANPLFWKYWNSKEHR